MCQVSHSGSVTSQTDQCCKDHNRLAAAALLSNEFLLNAQRLSRGSCVVSQQTAVMTLMTSSVACRAVLNQSSCTMCCNPLRYFPIQGNTSLYFLSNYGHNQQGLNV